MRPRKFFFLSLLFHTSTTVVHLFSTFSSTISLFDTQFLHLSTLPTVINFTRCNQFPTEIDSCCYGSDYVLQRTSCQLHFLVLTAFLNVIPVTYSFVPTNSEWIRVGFLSFFRSNRRRAIRVGLSTVLSSDSCYQNILVLAAWINFKVGTPI